MKKIFLILFIAFASGLNAQLPKYFIDNNLLVKNASAQKIQYPFVGGFLSPQFSNIDLDMDGKKDLFVFDRAGNKVLTYLYSTDQGGSWVYAPQYEVAFPQLRSWALLADYNNDGKEDIFTSADPAYFPQAVALYKNVSTPGVPAFQLVRGQLEAFQNDSNLPNAPVYALDKDISAVYDIDDDGDIDILSFDASASSITWYLNQDKEKGQSLDSLHFRILDNCWGSFQESMISRSITLGTPCFFGRYYPKTGGHSGSTMLYLDMDGDNDKDLVLGDISYDKLTILENGKTNFSWPIDTISDFDTIFPATNAANVYTFPAAFYVDVNNNGKKDLIVAPNFDGPVKGLNQIWLYDNGGATNHPSFSLQKTNFLQDQTLDFGSGVAPAFLDVDNDGDLDLILAHRGDFTVTQNAADRMTLLRNTGTTTKPEFTLDNNNDFLGLIQDGIRDMKPAFGDLNGDNKPDMVIGDQDGELHYYQNTSSGSNLTFATAVKKYMKIDVGLSAAPQIIDLDGDGLKDLVVGTGNGFIDFFKNKGTATAAQFDSVPNIDTLGGVYVSSYYWYKNWQTGDSSKVYDFEGYATPYFTQLDSAGPLELLVGSKSGKLWVFTGVDKNNLNTPFTEVDSVSYNHFTKLYGTYFGGARIVPAAAKLSDSTGAKPAIFMGNFRGGINYLSPVFDSTNYTTGIAEPFKELAVLIYPNPTAGEITIQRSLAQYPGDLEVSVIDMLGRLVYSGTIAGGNETGVINLVAAPGIYYVKLSGDQMYQTVQKVTVLR